MAARRKRKPLSKSKAKARPSTRASGSPRSKLLKYGHMATKAAPSSGREDLSRFVPAIEDFYKTVFEAGVLHTPRIEPFFQRWATRKSKVFATELRIVLQALLDASAKK
ncbi:MAG: hypothetical protein AMXMBFR58_28290 [Phycisphaerae bacterium]